MISPLSFGLAIPTVGGVDPLLLWGGVFVVLGLVVAFTIESQTREIDPEIEAEMADKAGALGRLRSGVGARADRQLRNVGVVKAVRIKLEVVGANVRPTEFFGSVGAVTVVAAVAGFVTRGPTFALVALVLVPLIAIGALDSKVKKQRASFAEQLPEMLQLLAGSLRAGMSLTQALAAVGHESPSPTREEIRKVMTENRLGRGFVESMREVAGRMESNDFEWVVSAVEIHEDIGGNLADVLDRVAATIRARNRVQGQVKALSAEARMSGHVMTLLPPGVFAIMAVANPSYAAELTDSSAGHTVLGAAVVMLFLGGAWLRNMAKFKF